jgi:hypothetical protein
MVREGVEGERGVGAVEGEGDRACDGGTRVVMAAVMHEYVETVQLLCVGYEVC